MADIEARLRAIEDYISIVNLIAQHPPSADTGAVRYTKGAWVEDGEFDRGSKLGAEKGREAIGALVAKSEHRDAIHAGMAHISGLPFVSIDGDRATVVHYLQIIVPEKQLDVIEVPNHGSGRGFRPFRVLASRWRLVRTPQGWKFKHRQVRLLDGQEGALELLATALSDAPNAG
jgi:SnoaL-like domain